MIAGVALIVAAVVVAGAIALGAGGLASADDAQLPASGRSQELTVVRGVIGSEKEALFSDPEAQEIFARHGLDVQVTTSGSWAMAERPGIEESDFASPSSEVAAAHLVDVHGDAVLSTTTPFYSPLAIATGTTVLDVLERNGMAEQRDGVWYLDMAAYLKAVSEGRRWSDPHRLRGVSLEQKRHDHLDRRALLQLSAHVPVPLELRAQRQCRGHERGGRPPAGLRRALPALPRPGLLAVVLAGPWESFLSKGPLNQPLTLIYESQYLEAQMNEPTRVIDAMRICYPSPTIFSDHVVVAFTKEGQRVQDVLENDPDMARVIARHGFRPNGANSGAFSETVGASGLSGYAADGTFIDAAQAPSYEVADVMLQTIEALY